jgi:CIC family chloride channel protein
VELSPADRLMLRLVRLLRWRLWIQERLQPSEWQATLLWAAVAGFLGAFVAILFSVLTEDVHRLFGGGHAGVVESMERLPWWACLLVPALGGLAAGLILKFGETSDAGAKFH